MGSYGIEFCEVLAEDMSQNAYLCFVKTRWIHNDLKIFFKEPSVILCVPLIIDDSILSISFMTDSDDFDKIWEQFQYAGSQFKVVSINANPPIMDNLYLLLTDRQREIIFYAIKNGYYEVPRRLNTTDLAAKFNISNSAVSEHLRKIERIVFHSIFKV